MKRQAKDCETIFAKHLFDKGHVFRIYKELLKLNNKKRSNPIKKWTKEQRGLLGKLLCMIL